MRHCTSRVIFAFLLIVLSFSFSTSYAQKTPLTEGLVLHLSFDSSNAVDSSGNRNNGVVNNIAFVPGVSSTGARFDGASSYISIPHSVSLDLTTSFTFSGWVKVASSTNLFTSYIVIFTRGDVSSYESAPYSVVFRNKGRNNMVPHARFHPSSGPIFISDLNIDRALAFDRWSFFTWKLDQGVLSIYKDGRKVGESDIKIASLLNSTSPLEIGRDRPGITEFFRGDLDEVRIYNRALSDQEITELYNQGGIYFLNLPIVRR